MDDEHGRYAALAVGHVLGGLGASEAADFRAHLGTCTLCRSRVAELRGIASDLTAAERDERARARVATAAPRRLADDDTVPSGGVRPGIRTVSVAVVVVSVLALGLAFWNLHLRTALAGYAAVAAEQSDTLAGLADGVRLDPTFSAGVRGLVVTDGDRVTLAVAGLTPLDGGEWLVAWFTDGDDVLRSRTLAGAGGLDEGQVAVRLNVMDAVHLAVTRETGPVGVRPGGAPVLDVDLPRGDTGAPD